MTLLCHCLTPKTSRHKFSHSSTLPSWRRSTEFLATDHRVYRPPIQGHLPSLHGQQPMISASRIYFTHLSGCILLSLFITLNLSLSHTTRSRNLHIPDAISLFTATEPHHTLYSSHHLSRPSGYPTSELTCGTLAVHDAASHHASHISPTYSSLDSNPSQSSILFIYSFSP